MDLILKRTETKAYLSEPLLTYEDKEGTHLAHSCELDGGQGSPKSDLVPLSLDYSVVFTA